MERSLLHVVCDYRKGDLAFSEVLAALMVSLDGSVRVHTTEVPSFDTISTGFVLAQLGLQSPELRPEKTFLFVNCAPRRDRTTARAKNDGERLVFGDLSSGISFLAVNAGHSLSFVRNDLTLLSSVSIPSHGSQFRSRDIFPAPVSQMVAGDRSFLLDRLDPLIVCPEVPTGVVAYVDSFGNMKTTFRSTVDPVLDIIREGQRIGIRIGNSATVQAFVATGSFNVNEGEVAFAPGSSGHNRRYWEIFCRGGRAVDLFNNPPSGTEIKLSI